MANANAAPKPAEVLARVVEVAAQVEANQGVDQAVANKGRLIRKAKNPLTEYLPDLVKGGAVEADVTAVITQLEAWANIFAPQDTQQWDKTSVNQDLAFLEAMAPYNVLTPEELATLETVKTTLKEARKGGTGQRAAREDQPAIEGRPVRVITTVGDTVLSNRVGNKANSASNIKTAAVAFLNSKLDEGKQITEDQSKALMAEIKKVVEDGAKSAKFLTMTFTAAAEDAPPTEEATK